MTHAQALEHDRRGLAGRGCPGELAEVARLPDARLDAGRVVPVEVVVYRCPACGMRLSIDQDGTVRNAYPEMVRSLAASLDARPLLPRGGEE